MYRNRALGRGARAAGATQRVTRKVDSDSSYSDNSDEYISSECNSSVSDVSSNDNMSISSTEDDRGRELARPVTRSQAQTRSQKRGTKRAADPGASCDNEHLTDSKRRRVDANAAAASYATHEYNPVIADVDFRLEPLYTHRNGHDAAVNDSYLVQKYNVLDVPTDAPYTAMVSLANGAVMPVIAIINGLFYTRAKIHDGRRAFAYSGTSWVRDDMRNNIDGTYVPAQQETLAHIPYTYFLITSAGDTVREFTAPLKVISARVWCALPADKHKYALSKFYFYRAWLLASVYVGASSGASDNKCTSGANDTADIVFLDGAFNKFCTVSISAGVGALRDPALNVVAQDNAERVYTMYPKSATDDMKTTLIIKAADCAYWYERYAVASAGTHASVSALTLTPWVFIEKITGMVTMRVGRHDIVVCKVADAVVDATNKLPCQIMRVYGRGPLTRLREVPEADYPTVHNNSLLWKESGRRIDFNLRKCVGCGQLMDEQEGSTARKCGKCVH